MENAIPFLAAAFVIILVFGVAPVRGQNLELVLLDAAAAGQTDLVKALLDGGANIEIKNNVGATALILAAAKGHSEVVKLLLDRGAAVNVKTATGITPLMAAATAGNAEMVKLLLEKGADVSARDQQGRTAMNLAEATGATDVYALLKVVDKSSAPAAVPGPELAGPPAVPVGEQTNSVHTEVIRSGDSPGGLTVRAEPSPTAKVIAYLTVGATVTYSGEASNGWVKLSAPIRDGWIAASSLRSGNSEATVVSVDNPEQCLRVRNGPGTDKEKIGCLPKGAKIKLTGTVQNGWAQLVEPMAGWVSARQIQAPGLVPAKAATSGEQKEQRGTSQATGQRRQQSDSDSDFTKADKEFDKEISELKSENEDAGSIQPGNVQPGQVPTGGVFRVGPLGIGIGGF